MQTKLVAAANLTATGAEMYDAGVATNRAMKKLSSASFDATVKALGTRLMQLSVRRNLTAGIVFLVLAFGLALAMVVSRSLDEAAEPRRRSIRQHLDRPLRQPDRHELQRRGGPGVARSR